MAACDACAQMYPLVAHRDALVADVYLGRGVMALLEVFAVCHGSSEMVAFTRLSNRMLSNAMLARKMPPPRRTPSSSACTQMIELCGQASRAGNKRGSKCRETPEPF